MKNGTRWSILVALCALAVCVDAQSPDLSRFAIFWRGARIGSENVTVTETGDGWTIRSVGSQTQPVDVTINKFEVTYSSDWQPRSLAIDSVLRGQILTIATAFAPPVATNDVFEGGQKTRTTRPVSAKSVVLQSNCYGGYEALAARLATASQGARIPVYVAPQGEASLTVDRVTPLQIVTLTGSLELRQFDVTIATGAAPLVMNIGIDARNRLVRLMIPAASLVVAREDIASVMTREKIVTNPGDEDVIIPATSFSLAATITKPKPGSAKGPAVVLVSGAGSENRDELVAGIPIFANLAGALADAGYLVVRFDKRGVGQSGGRAENAAIADFASDVQAVLEWLRKRKDVDEKRIALIGFGEGGPIALTIAKRGSPVRALALLGVSGLSGRDLVLWQQQRALARSSEPEEDKKAKIALQQRVIDAAIKGTGWEGIPPAIRRQADSPWFTSWLLFDPMAVIRDVHQPILILQGSLDSQVAPDDADRLEILARRRRKLPSSATTKVVIPGVNHLLVPARTGEEEEYSSLAGTAVSAEVKAAITSWLKDALADKKK